jgi:hypothetical protein
MSVLYDGKGRQMIELRIIFIWAYHLGLVWSVTVVLLLGLHLYLRILIKDFRRKLQPSYPTIFHDFNYPIFPALTFLDVVIPDAVVTVRTIFLLAPAVLY